MGSHGSHAHHQNSAEDERCNKSWISFCSYVRYLPPLLPILPWVFAILDLTWGVETVVVVGKPEAGLQREPLELLSY